MTKKKTPTPAKYHESSWNISSLPRLYMSPTFRAGGKSSPRRRQSHNSSSSPCDRFIPNRSRLDVSHVRSYLLSQVESVDRERSSGKNLQYRQNLQRALFGTDFDYLSVLGFSTTPSPSRSILFPFDLNFLRPISSISRPKCPQTQHISTDRNGFFNIPRYFEVETPHLYKDGNLNLISSFFDYIAFAIHDRVYFYDEDTNTIDYLGDLTSLEGGISSLKFCTIETTGFYDNLAVGGYGKVQVWNTPCGNKKAEFGNHDGYVTAFEWISPNEVVAASDNKICIHDIRLSSVEVNTISSFDYPGLQSVTNIKLQENILACAGESSIRLWDIRYSQNNHEPLHLFNHANVRGLGFCPSQRHTLATGGRDGVTVWNSLSGHPRSCISIPNTTVNALLWSPFGKQILACHDHKLSKWSIVPGDSSLLEQEWGLPIENFNPDPPRIKEYKVVSLDYLRNGRVVSLDARGWLLHTSVFRDPLSLWEQKCSEMKRAPEFSVVR